MNRVIHFALARPRAVIASWLLVLLVSAPFALHLEGALKAGGFSSPRGASVHAQATLEKAFHEAPNSLLVVLHDKQGKVTGQLPAARKAAERPEVSQVTDVRTHPDWVSKDGKTTFLQLSFHSDNTTVQNLVPTVRDDITAKVGHGTEVDVTGAPALDYALNVHSQQDVTRAEAIAFPVLFVVLLLVFRSVAAMVVPLALSGVTLAITQAIGYGLAKATDVNNLFVNIVSMVGLAVAVDYSLFIIKRFREELDEDQPVPDALKRTMSTVGHSVVFSGLAVAVAMSALFIPRAMSFTSIALGGLTVTVIAVAMATTLLPAVLVLLGHRINWGSLRRRKDKDSAPKKAPAAQAGRLVKRPALLLVVLVAAFAAIAYPATRLTWQVPVASATILPSDDSARIGIERIKKDIGLPAMFPVQVVLTAPDHDAPALLKATERITADAKRAPGADGVQSVTTLGVPPQALPQTLANGGTGLPAQSRAGLTQLWAPSGPGQLATRVVVTPDGDPDSASAHHLVNHLQDKARSVDHGTVTVRIAGSTATGSDFDQLVLDSVPLVVGTVALLSLLILLFAFRSLLLPLLALAFNAMVVAASLGVLALISGDSEHTINSVTPLMLFSVMFGLSMDYMVIMISRMREMRINDGLSHHDSVLGGLARTAGLVNGAAVIMVAVFASFTTAQISIVRELGISLGVAVIVDAVVIRRLVMPATLLLIGDRVWGRALRRATDSADPAAPATSPDPEKEVPHVLSDTPVR
ncbi:MMPL family transporter [Streptomyces sp. NPDC051453]|uniref:MMPL family transporter n=1 Tax=Streptomyces sp. NPDC051453 TaxID=3154941 RepID=UPI00341CD791